MQQRVRIGRMLGASGQVAAMGAIGLLTACTSPLGVGDAPASFAPSGPGALASPRAARTVPAARLVHEGDVAWGQAAAEIIDTARVQQVEDQAWGGLPTPVKNMLPVHVKPGAVGAGAPNALDVGRVLDEPRTITEMMFPTISATGWVPPDPTLAVSPTHVLVTVNQDIAWYTRAGAQQFRSNMGSPGNPGFFEPLGAQNFVFDPKVIYDHYAQRFVVLALETYTSTEAWITFAVSDDSDPNGTWYKYRTDAVVDIGTNTVWWDFPGIGYDQNAYYVTGNLFSLPNGGSYGGAGIRIFNKTPLLTGGTATYSTLRIAGAYTVMPALHFGNPGVPYFVDPTSSTNVRVYAVTNPLTTPAIATTNVVIPSTNGPIEPPTVNGNPVSGADITMPYWRNGRLSMIQNASVNNRNVARWHEFNTGTWPTSGSVTRVQSGDVDAGLEYHTVFPAIASNVNGDLGVVIGRTSASERIGVAVAGRRSADPVGRMGYPVIVKAGDRDGGGRWGDYQAVAVDPVDDTTFWVIGEYLPVGNGWQNWVTSFRVSDQSVCHPIPDSLGAVQTTLARTIDVLANDWHSTAAMLTISTFATTSTRGGTITRSVGTGPGGRDQLVYTPPLTLPNGADSFSYTVRDPSGNTASAAVVATLYNPATYRAPDAPIATRGGVRATYFDLNAPTVLPDFSTLTAFDDDVVAQINYPSSSGTFATSTRLDNIGAVFEGYVEVPATDLYTFYTNSDDGSKLFLGGQLIVNNDGAHGMVERGSSLQGLQAGKHRVRVDFFEGGGSQGLIVSYQGLNLAKQVVPSSRWSIDRCVADVDNGTGGGVPDGGVTIDDLLYYLSIFEAGLASADVDDGTSTGRPDGGVTIDDLLFYLVRFESGC